MRGQAADVTKQGQTWGQGQSEPAQVKGEMRRRWHRKWEEPGRAEMSQDKGEEELVGGEAD